MRTRFFKILLIYQIFTFIAYFGFPLAANHGRLDLRNDEMRPYLLVSIFILIGVLYTSIVIYAKPQPQSFFYTMGKLFLPLITVSLIMDLIEWRPMSWGLSTSVIFAIRIGGAALAGWLTIGFIQNKPIN